MKMEKREGIITQPSFSDLNPSSVWAERLLFNNKIFMVKNFPFMDKLNHKYSKNWVSTKIITAVEKFSAENLTIQNILLGVFMGVIPTKVTIKCKIKYTLQEIKYKMERFLLLGKLILLGAKNIDRKSTA